MLSHSNLNPTDLVHGMLAQKKLETVNFIASWQAGAEIDGTSSLQPDELQSMSADVSRLESSLPFSLTGIPDHDQCQSILSSLLSLLPPYPRASALCETYMEHAAWIFQPIRREELIDDILSPVYALAQETQSNTSESKTECPEHTIAALYMVFSQGALMDLTLPPCNQEAEDYFHLGRVALSLRSVFESPTIHTIEALAVMGYCYSNRGKQYALHSAWSVIALASKLAQSVCSLFDPVEHVIDRIFFRWVFVSICLRPLFHQP